MIYTARQLEDLHKANGHIVLPYGARLTPLAVDWARAKKIAVGYGPDELVKAGNGKPTATAAPQQTPSGAYLWWCDGPCGAAKAAVGALARESSLSPIDLPAEAKRIACAVKSIAKSVKDNKSVGAALLVASAGAAVVLANRCNSLRAVVGTTLESLEAAIAQVAPNVLIVEYPGKTFPQIKNLLSRFIRARRDVSEELNKQLAEVASCA